MLRAFGSRSAAFCCMRATSFWRPLWSGEGRERVGRGYRRVGAGGCSGSWSDDGYGARWSAQLMHQVSLAAARSLSTQLGSGCLSLTRSSLLLKQVRQSCPVCRQPPPACGALVCVNPWPADSGPHAVPPPHAVFRYSARTTKAVCSRSGSLILLASWKQHCSERWSFSGGATKGDTGRGALATGTWSRSEFGADLNSNEPTQLPSRPKPLSRQPRQDQMSPKRGWNRLGHAHIPQGQGCLLLQFCSPLLCRRPRCCDLLELSHIAVQVSVAGS